MSASQRATRDAPPASDSEVRLRRWLLLVHAQTVVPPPPSPWRRRATLPWRLARRLVTLVNEVGPQQAASVSVQYARRRLTDRP